MSATVKKPISLKRLKQINKIWHPESTLVFKSPEEQKVIGRFFNDEFISLDDVALELCAQWNFKFDPELVEEVDDEEEEDEQEQEEAEQEEAVVQPAPASPEKITQHSEQEVEQEAEQEVDESDSKTPEEEPALEEKLQEASFNDEESTAGNERELYESVQKTMSLLSETTDKMFTSLVSDRDHYRRLYEEEVSKNGALTAANEELVSNLSSLSAKFENMKKIFTM